MKFNTSFCRNATFVFTLKAKVFSQYFTCKGFYEIRFYSFYFSRAAHEEEAKFKGTTDWTQFFPCNPSSKHILIMPEILNSFLFLVFPSPTILLPLACGLIVIIVAYIKLWKLRKTEEPESVGIFGIWLMGIIALLLGIFGQVLGMMQAFDAIAQAGNVSPELVANAIKSTYLSTSIGFAALIVALIAWGILKGIKDKKTYLKGKLY